MADNIQLNAGVDGEVLASKDIGGIQHQKVIIVDDSGGVSGFQSSMLESAEDVNTKTTNSGTGWSGATWTGAGEQPQRDYVRSSIKSDVAGTVFFEFGYDGITWVSTFPTAGFDAGTFHEYHAADLGFRYFRVRVVFDSLPTSVDIHTYYSDNPPALNSPLSQSVSGDQDAMTVKAVAHGEDASNAGTFVQQKFTSDGAAFVSSDSSLINFSYDALDLTEVDSVTERWDYFVGGLVGTRTAYITNVYSDSSKLVLISSERTNV